MDTSSALGHFQKLYRLSLSGNSHNSRKKQCAIQSGHEWPSYLVPAPIDDKSRLSNSGAIPACVQKSGAHVDSLAMAKLTKLVERIISNMCTATPPGHRHRAEVLSRNCRPVCYQNHRRCYRKLRKALDAPRLYRKHKKDLVHCT